MQPCLTIVHSIGDAFYLIAAIIATANAWRSGDRKE